MPRKSNEIRKCKWCEKPAKKYYQGDRFKGYLRTCGSEECLKAQYKDNKINKLKIFREERICEICGNNYIATSTKNRWCKNCIPNKHARTIYERYHLLPNEEKKLKERNNGICPICNKRKASAIDHNHITGEVRGYICSKCNIGLHYLEDLELKSSMELYLKEEM